MIELTYQGAIILGGIVLVAWIAIVWSERKHPPKAGE
jgi:hypothetical protein